MAIEFRCTCGKRLSVPEDAAGHKARCPTCGMVVIVPGTRAPEPEDEPAEPKPQPASKVDAVMEQFMADLAESRERAPEFTWIATAFAVWAGISFVLTFLVCTISSQSQYNVAVWVLVWVPQCAVGGLVALGMIKSDRRTPTLVAIGSLVIVGANWPLLWSSAIAAAGSAAGVLMMLISLANLAGYVFLYWYFRRSDTLALFVPKAESAAEEPESKPAGGS